MMNQYLSIYFCKTFLVCSLGKKEVEHCRKQLSDAKRQAESIAVITPELEKEFLEVWLHGLHVQDNIMGFNFVLYSFRFPSAL